MDSENQSMGQNPDDSKLAELTAAVDEAMQDDEEQKETTKGNIFDELQKEIMQSDLSSDEKNKRLSMLLKASNRKVNLMLVGATGSGKSSTINALFDMSVAKVGIGVDPETKDIEKYTLGNLVVWDTPGLGDEIETDKQNITQIVKKLSETDENDNLLIDLVLVIVDASSKDMSVNFDVINNTIIPCLGEGNEHRILIALNQSDMAMKGRHWDFEKNAPDEVLLEFLKSKAKSVKRRINNATSVAVEPICYAAGYTDGEEKQAAYNLAKLLYYILMAVPNEKRLVLLENLNEDEDNWLSNDEDYMPFVKESFFESLKRNASEGAEKGAFLGTCSLGIPGLIVGAFVGGIVGSLRAIVVNPLLSLFN